MRPAAGDLRGLSVSSGTSAAWKTAPAVGSLFRVRMMSLAVVKPAAIWNVKCFVHRIVGDGLLAFGDGSDWRRTTRSRRWKLAPGCVAVICKSLFGARTRRPALPARVPRISLSGVVSVRLRVEIAADDFGPVPVRSFAGCQDRLAVVPLPTSLIVSSAAAGRVERNVQARWA